MNTNPQQLSASAINRFGFCPRWFFIHYVLGFQPKSPIKAKFPIGDALHHVLATQDKTKFMDRAQGLIRSETPAEEDVPMAEFLERGLLLADKALDWFKGFSEVLWQEKLVKKTLDNGISVFGYPDLFGVRQGKRILVDYKISYREMNAADAFSEIMQLAIYKLGLEEAQVGPVDETIIASMIVRDRKERNSPRAKTPIVDIVEVPVVITSDILTVLMQTFKDISLAYEHNWFPALGIKNGVCEWCPNGQVMKDKRFCHYPDEMLKAFSQSSLQRSSIERWRNEF